MTRLTNVCVQKEFGRKFTVIANVTQGLIALAADVFFVARKEAAIAHM